MESKVYLDRYRLSLGRNGLPVELHRTAHGTTYRAHEIASGREVAVELIPLTSAQSGARERLREAAQAAQQINHPNIPVLRDFDLEEDQLVLVTDPFDGHTAEAWVAARGPLPLGAVLRVALQVASAFGAASFHRLQHPAINPGNILFVPGQTAEGEWPAIKILHWLAPSDAIAEGADPRADAAARYASPEQLRSGEADFASSIFSLGCTMWFLLTGAPPAVPGASGLRSSLATLRGVPKIVRHLLGRMLRSDPAERPQDPVVLQAYLQTCLARVERREKMSRRFGLPVAPTTARAVAARPARKLRTKPLALAALLLLLGTLAVVALPRILHARRSAIVASAPVAPAPTEFAGRETPNEPLEEDAPPAEGPEGAVVMRNESPAPAETTAVPNEQKTSARLADAPTSTSVRETTASAERASKPNEQETTARFADAAASPPDAAVVEDAPRIARQTAPPPPAESRESAPAATPTVASNDPDPAANEEPVREPAVAEVAPPRMETTAEPTPLIAESTPAETPRRSQSKIAARKQPTQKSRKAPVTVAQHRKSSSHPSRKSRLAHAEVRRGRKIPQLRVGSDRAELVGTTSDGRWILSVSSSGERIVVPPPPGYAP